MSGETTATTNRWEPLQTYTAGTPRSALLAIDREVVQAVGDQGKCTRLAGEMAGLLDCGLSLEAKRYLCTKLAILGCAQAAQALAKLLTDPAVETDARTALEAMTHSAADAALCEALPRLQGVARTGAIISLGVRRDPRSVSLLARELKSSNPETARAAADALGNIGTEGAGRELARHFRRLDPKTQRGYADALLVCAEHLPNSRTRQELISLLQTARLPQHARGAADQLQSPGPQRATAQSPSA